MALPKGCSVKASQMDERGNMAVEGGRIWGRSRSPVYLLALLPGISPFFSLGLGTLICEMGYPPLLFVKLGWV